MRTLGAARSGYLEPEEIAAAADGLAFFGGNDLAELLRSALSLDEAVTGNLLTEIFESHDRARPDDFAPLEPG